MTDALLLPSSSTGLERDLSTSMDALPRLGAAAELIRDAKRENIPDSVVPFLLYEYGLGELLPYLSDPRTAISTGVLWQRLRGTPKSFSIALGWIGNDGTIEESEGNTINWSQFQLGLDSAPVDLSQTDSVVEIGRLSSPVRSSLFRIYGGWYDGRRFQLDDHKLSSLDTLCDHTGVYLKSEWPQLSFGREFKDAQGDISGDLAAALGIHRFSGISGRYEDRTILSNSILGETSWRTLHIEDLSSVISRLHFSVSGPWWNQATDWAAAYDWTQVLDWAGLQNKFTPALQFARAGLYLSDYSELGDTNSCFPARFLEEFGDGAVLLSEADPDTGEHILSEHLSRVEFTEINERIDRNTDAEQTHVGSVHLRGQSADPRVLSREHYKTLAYDDSFELSRSRLSEFTPLINEQAISRGHTTSAEQFETQSAQWQAAAQTWDSVDWSADGWYEVEATAVDTWANTYSWKQFPQLEQILGFSLAGICLSETGQLSDALDAWRGLLDPAAPFMGTATETNADHPARVGIIPSTVVVDETAGTISATKIVKSPYTFATQYWQPYGTITVPLFNSAGRRQSFTLGEIRTAEAPGFSVWTGFYVGDYATNLFYGVESDDGILGDTQATLSFTTSERFERSHGTTSAAHNPSGFWYHLRERFATLAYDDSFELSRTRLDEFIPLVNEQAITREHGGAGAWNTEQFNSWNDTSPSWAAASDWQASGCFDAANEPTWFEAYAWQVFPQLEHVLSFHQSHQYLSDTADGLSETDSVLGFEFSQRFERDHFAQATENRQSIAERQHVRTYYPATVALYIEPTWANGDWAGEDATDWHETTEDWQAGSWASLDWVDSSTITWANQFMWGTIARWQVASLVVESVHETHA